MINTGQCPNCFATNSFSVTDCLECKRPLPWAVTVSDLQKQVDAAKAASDAAQQQAQQLQQGTNRTQIAQNIQQAQAMRAQNAAQNSRTPSAIVAPGEPLPVNVFHVFADAFVGRFAETLDGIDKASAAWFGLFCMVISNVCIVVGARMIAQDVSEVFRSFLPFAPPAPSPDTPATDANAIPGVEEVISLWKLAVVAFTPWLTIAASCTLARKLFGGEERHLEGDVFIAGVTLLPFSIVVLLAGLLGYGNWEIISVLLVFALSYSILMLYRGLTTVSNIRDMAAAFCVPQVIMLSAYLAKVVFTRLLTL